MLNMVIPVVYLIMLSASGNMNRPTLQYFFHEVQEYLSNLDIDQLISKKFERFEWILA